MNNELATQENKSLSVFDADQFDHWYGVAQKLASSEMIPPNYKGKPMDILISIEMGRQVGLGMMQALQSIAVINRIPCMYGDAPLAVCQNHPSYEWIREEPIVSGNTVTGYRCTIKRKNNDEHVVVFTIDNAKKAGLWGKSGPWSQYPERMLQMRARGFALRNTFPDALKGIKIKEEVEDMQIIDATYEVKQSQKDKMQSLLTKKGFNNASTGTSTENISNDSNAVNMSTDIDLFHSDSNIEQADTRAAGRVPVAEAPESEIKNNDKTTAPNKCTKEQLENIEFKMQMSGEFDDARRLKALKHFGINTFPELTFEQAEELIKIIDKA